MAYGTVKVDNIVFDDGGSDQTVTVSGLYNSLTSGITVTGTISGAVVIGSTSVSGTTVAGVTVTGTTVQGASGTFTSLTGTTIQGTTATYTTGSFTSLTGTTTTGTTANFVSGVFTTSVSGTTVIAPTGTFTSLTGTTTQGTTATYTTGSFTSLTGTTTTGTTLSFTSGVFTTLSGATATFTSGIIASGTAAAPSLAILGDPDTGVFSPGANQLAVATNGTGRLFIGNTGNIGLSEASPTARLHLSGSLTAGGIKIVDSNMANAAPGIEVIGKRNDNNSSSSFAGKLLLSRNTTTGAVVSSSILGKVAFGGNHTDGTEANILYSASIVGAADGAFNSATDMPTALVFNTGATGRLPDTANVTTGTERLRITSAGLVGIGTSSPGKTLDVVGQLRIQSGASSGYALLEYGSSSTATNNWHVGSEGDGSYRFYNGTLGAGVERLRITAAGNVGIGTTSPGALLELSGTGQAQQIIRSTDNASVSIRCINTSNADVYMGSSGGDFRVQTNTLERIRVDSSGRLLVGTSSTSLVTTAVLQGNSGGATNAAAFDLQRGQAAADIASGAGLGFVRFADNAGNAYAQIVGQTDGVGGVGDYPGRLVFSTTADGASSPTERMRIDSAGNTLFGTSDTVPGIGDTNTGFVVNPGGVIYVSGTSSSSSFNRNGTDGSAIIFHKAGVAVGSISVTATNTTYNTSSDYRLKENVVDLDGAIDRLKQLPVYRFNFIADPNTVVDGFIAHEAAEVVPECVTGAKDEVDADGNPVYQGIDQSKLVPLLTAALQEAVAKIESLEARLTAAGL